MLIKVDFGLMFEMDLYVYIDRLCGNTEVWDDSWKSLVGLVYSLNVYLLSCI